MTNPSPAQQTALRGASTLNCNAVPSSDAPKAPPGANRVQLELWRRILSQRSKQLQSLPPTTLQSYADGIALDLKSSRFMKVAGWQREVDLANGFHSAHLLSHPPPASVAVHDVVQHIMALFYRSIDERLSPCERKYGLDAVKRALLSLDTVLAEQKSDTQTAEGMNQSLQNGTTSQHEEQQEKELSRDITPAANPAINADDVLTQKVTAPDDKNGSTVRAAEKVVTSDGVDEDKDGPGCQSVANESAQWDVGEQKEPDDSSQEKRKADGNNNEEGATKMASKRQRTEQSLPEKATANRESQREQNRDSDVGEQNRDPDVVVIDSDDESATDKAPDVPSLEKAAPHQTSSTSAPKNQSVSKEKECANDGAAAGSTFEGKDSSGKPSSTQQPSVQKKLQPSNVRKSAPRNDALESSSPTKTAIRALPPPVPYSCMRHIAFLADNHTPFLASASLHPRHPCILSYDAGFNVDGSGACLENKTFLGVRQRLETFDPFWKIIHELGTTKCAGGQGKTTQAATRTAPCVSSLTLGNFPTSCAVVEVGGCDNVKLSNLSDLDWGQRKTTYKTGDRRILLRMLPLKRSEKDEKKSSDTHKWPIGTFIQLSRGAKEQVLLVAQRRQQSHDPSLWKGLSHPLDLTTFLPDARLPFSIKICAREVIERVTSPKFELGAAVSKEFEDDDGEMRPFSGTITHYDPEYKLYQITYEDGDAEELTEAEVAPILVKKPSGIAVEPKILQGSYGIHLAVCEYVGPEDLSNQLLKVLPTIPFEESRRMAKQYLVRQTVSIDSDDEDDDLGDGDTSLNFTLLCPMSKMAIRTPVRGKNCKHIQCFDLASFLHSNKSVSGGRWRCGCCEDFLSVKDLVRCGLFEAMLRDHREEVSGARHEVSFKSDGTWCLKDEEKRRYAKGGAAGAKGGSSGAAGDAQARNGGGESKGSQPEVIDLL